MTGKERMLAAIKGEPVDRVPIWLREGFDFQHPIASADDFSMSWKKDPRYIELWEFAREHCDMRVSWSPGDHFNRTMGIPPHRMTSETSAVSVVAELSMVMLDAISYTAATSPVSCQISSPAV